MLETQINHTKINTNTHIERINVIIYESFVTYSTTIQYNNLRFFLFRLIQSNTHVQYQFIIFTKTGVPCRIQLKSSLFDTIYLYDWENKYSRQVQFHSSVRMVFFAAFTQPPPNDSLYYDGTYTKQYKRNVISDVLKKKFKNNILNKELRFKNYLNTFASCYICKQINALLKTTKTCFTCLLSGTNKNTSNITTCNCSMFFFYVS